MHLRMHAHMHMFMQISVDLRTACGCMHLSASVFLRSAHAYACIRRVFFTKTYPHERTSSKRGAGMAMETCRFYAQGRCAFGTACRLSHDLPSAQSPNARRAAQRGIASPQDAQWEESCAGEPLPEPGAACSTVWGASLAGTSSGSAARSAPEDEVDEKEVRKLQKALREIAALEQRREAGEEGLQGNQLRKMEKKEEYTRRLRQLEALRAPAAPAAERGAPEPERGAPNAALPMCRHFLAGRCSFGDACRNSHAGAFSASAPRRPEEPSFDAEDPECGICFESIRKKGERFGILESCDHAFCLSCIRSWRKQREQQDRNNLRLCPVCRNESFFVVPSDEMFVDPEKKSDAIEQYKVEMARIPCKLFDYGRGSCPFGTSCFYAHLNPDGTRYVPPPLRWRNGADGSEVVGEVKLSDFLMRSLALP